MVAESYPLHVSLPCPQFHARPPPPADLDRHLYNGHLSDSPLYSMYSGPVARLSRKHKQFCQPAACEQHAPAESARACTPPGRPCVATDLLPRATKTRQGTGCSLWIVASAQELAECPSRPQQPAEDAEATEPHHAMDTLLPRTLPLALGTRGQYQLCILQLPSVSADAVIQPRPLVHPYVCDGTLPCCSTCGLYPQRIVRVL